MNNYWEDKYMSEELKTVHNESITSMGIPKWAIFDCPFCKEHLAPRSVRSIGICCNARNLGDISVEFCCDKCSRMDTMYFRKAAETVEDFICMLSEEFSAEPKEPLLEENMYALQYNNLMERCISSKEK